MESKEKLLNCPLCGGEAKLRTGCFNTNLASVMCLKCGVNTRIYETNEEAIEAWNGRTDIIPVGSGENYKVVQR